MTPGPLPDAPLGRIRHHLVGLRMPRALEALGAVVQQIERGQIGAIEAIDTLLAEELTVREGRRIKAALQMAQLATIKTISGFDFSFQPSLDRNRTRPGVMARIRSVALNVLRANGVHNVSLALYANAVSFDHLMALGTA